jgi:uncharacterized protein
MVYVDTSVLVALHLNEPNSQLAERWYAKCTEPMVSAIWCVTEFASALGIKLRTGQINADQSTAAWLRFEAQCRNELQLVSVEADMFHKAALLALNSESNLRSGDSLHLACAVALKANSLATFDGVLATNSERLDLKLVFPRPKV